MLDYEPYYSLLNSPHPLTFHHRAARPGPAMLVSTCSGSLSVIANIDQQVTCYDLLKYPDTVASVAPITLPKFCERCVTGLTCSSSKVTAPVRRAESVRGDVPETVAC